MLTIPIFLRSVRARIKRARAPLSSLVAAQATAYESKGQTCWRTPKELVYSKIEFVLSMRFATAQCVASVDKLTVCSLRERERAREKKRGREE